MRGLGLKLTTINEHETILLLIGLCPLPSVADSVQVHRAEGGAKRPGSPPGLPD